jgi:non-ribosomal peptide synthetase component E (peptide arylation enzyme)
MLVNEFLERSAERFSDKAALVCDGRRLTYGQVDAQADQATNGVLSALLVHQQFVDSFPPRPVQEAHPVRICQGGR